MIVGVCELVVSTILTHQTCLLVSGSLGECENFAMSKNNFMSFSFFCDLLCTQVNIAVVAEIILKLISIFPGDSGLTIDFIGK